MMHIEDDVEDVDDNYEGDNANDSDSDGNDDNGHGGGASYVDADLLLRDNATIGDNNDEDIDDHEFE